MGEGLRRGFVRGCLAVLFAFFRDCFDIAAPVAAGFGAFTLSSAAIAGGRLHPRDSFGDFVRRSVVCKLRGFTVSIVIKLLLLMSSCNFDSLGCLLGLCESCIYIKAKRSTYQIQMPAAHSLQPCIRVASEKSMSNWRLLACWASKI